MRTKSTLAVAAAAMSLLLAASAEAADKGGVIGLVTRTSGAVSVTAPGGRPEPALDLVQLGGGERYEVKVGGSLQIVYFADGRRERWSGPAKLLVRAGGATALDGSPQVSFLPAAAVKALKRTPPRKRASSSARAGGHRVRGMTSRKKPGVEAAKGAAFDEASARKAVEDHAADRQARELPEGAKAAPAKTRSGLQLPQVSASFRGGEASSALKRAAETVGFMVLRDKGDVIVQLGPGGRPVSVGSGDLQVDLPAGADTTSALRGVARLVQLDRIGEARAAGRVPVAVHIVSLGLSVMEEARSVAHTMPGDQVALEFTNQSAIRMGATLYERNPEGGFSAVWPPAGKPLLLGPFERRRLGEVFEVSPPNGTYHYVLVTTPDAASAGMKAPAAGLMTTPTPAAAQDLPSVPGWGAAFATMVLEP